MKTFSEMGINERLVASLTSINFVTPTEVQEIAIPKIMEGKDLVVRSKTGTGKTGAFLVPILNNAKAHETLYALIIVPTRELALQVSSVAEKLGRPLGIRTTTIYGGASINVQVQNLRNGTNIVVGTPGRILDLIERGALNLSSVRYLVLDEADVMLDMGFIDDVELIMSRVPTTRQTLLFSATIPREIQYVANRHMNSNKESIIVGEEEKLTVDTITHKYVIVGNNQKFATLLAYIDEYKPNKAIVFTNTKYEADKVYDLLRNSGRSAILMHGGLTQAKREHSLGMFRGDTQFLIATNLASRGLDIAGITDIINFDVPDVPNIYVHRVGRTARMGNAGRAFTIFTQFQKNVIPEIEYKANIKMERINLDIERYEQEARNALGNSYRERRYEERESRGSSFRGGYGRSRFGNRRDFGNRFNRNKRYPSS